MNDQAGTVRRAYKATANLPAVCSEPSPAHCAGAVYAAQVLGAAEQRRGLKGGASVLDAARRAYLGAEWSGRGDRRGSPGSLALMRI